MLLSSRLTVQTHSLPSQGLLLVALASVAVGTACSNDDIVYDNLEPFNPPADGGLGFLGYYVAAEKQTLCGNCHANLQASWIETAHADAWAGLQSSDHADAFCEECHAVTELGNSATVAGGYNVVPDASYHDVQCESCHGPGVDQQEVSAATEARVDRRIEVGSDGRDRDEGDGLCPPRSWRRSTVTGVEV